jgi:transcriptional regulator of heat shock response
MSDLTQRQIKILKCITEEFIETAAPVGSETLEKKFSWEFPRLPLETKWLL